MIIKKENWIPSQIINGDTNPLHFNEDYARKKGFKSIIAPGIYVGSLIEKEPYFKECGQLNLKFIKEVEDGDNVNIIKDGKDLVWKNQNDEIVIKGRIGEYPENEVNLEGHLCHEGIINKHDGDKFYEILEMKSDGVPRMYAASLIPAALLRYTDKLGIYRKQEFNFYKNANLGDRIGVHIRRLNKKDKIENYYAFCKNQNGELIVGGKITCVEIK